MPVIKSTKRIVFTGGGTGGHIVPLLVIFEALKSAEKDFSFEPLFVGTRGSIEEKIVKSKGLDFQSIQAGKWRRYLAGQNFWDIFITFRGFIQSVGILKKFKPDLILAKGGYVSFPVILAAKFLGIPIFIHESDSVMGWVNKIASRWASKIFVGFPANFHPDIKKEKLVESGVPIEKNFFNAKEIINKKPIILIMGGSQGSARINQVIKEILSELLKKYGVFHFTGERDFFDFKKIRDSLDIKDYQVLSFVNNLWEYMGKADLIISRAGGSSLAEIAALGKPSILIPLTLAANNHQAQNADFFYQHKAAEVIAENDLVGEVLLEKIYHILGEKKLNQEMRQNMKMLARPDAGKIIADEIVKFLGAK